MITTKLSKDKIWFFLAAQIPKLDHQSQEPGLATIPKASIRYRYWIVLVRYYKDR
jgi:hypothetical protein